MAIRLNPLVIPPENPFLNCKLEREKYADILTSLVSTYADGFVMAINNKWGTGKTTFVQMWEKKLQRPDNGFKTLYFNAWENDFDNDALTALIAELSKLKEDDTEQEFNELIKKGAVITKKLVPAIIKSLIGKYVGNELVKELSEAIAEGGSELLHEEIQDFLEKKKQLEQFRITLKKFLAKTIQDKPVIFIIDELDRCRPNYAVEVLEKVKHFFSVPGIVFVLSIDKTQLGHAIRGVYRSHEMDADEYLRRFIDVEYSIPEPDTMAFCNYLFDYFGFNEFLQCEERIKKYSQLRNDPDALISASSLLFAKANLSLRQQEKIYAQARIALRSFKIGSYVLPPAFIILLFLKHHHSELYYDIKSLRYSPQQLVDKLESIFPISHDNEVKQFFASNITLILFLYYTSLRNSQLIEQNQLFSKNDAGDTIVLIKFNKFHLDSSIYDHNQALFWYKNHMDYNRLEINFIIDKIDLIKPIISS